jgi:lipid-binding SYLF domain-containing protein
MQRRFLAAGIAAAAFTLAISPGAFAQAASDQQALVDRARQTVGQLRSQPQFPQARDLFHRARAVLIIPRFYKAGFFFGGAGGKGVLLVRSARGWSAPAFYTIGSGSFGLQIGLEQSEMVLFIMTQKALEATMRDKVTLGATGGLAVATIGGNLSGATTAAAGADIVSWAESQGAYAGISLEGSVVAPDGDADAAYYGRPVTSEQVVYQMSDRQPTGLALQRELASVR